MLTKKNPMKLRGGGRGLPKGLRLKARSKSKAMRNRKQKAESAKKRKEFILGTAFFVLVMGQTLLPQVTSVNHTKKQQLSRTSRSSRTSITNIGGIQEVWQIACTGNTCRSPALMLAGHLSGYDINTCGTDSDKPGSSATPASLTALEGTPNKHSILAKHRSKKCQPFGLFSGPPNNKQRRVFGVVAQENKLDLEKLYNKTYIGVKNPPPMPPIVVLGDVVPACKVMDKDPYYVSKSYVCPLGNCSDSQLATESAAYKQLHVDAKDCINGLNEYHKKGGPSLGKGKRSSRVSRSLSTHKNDRPSLGKGKRSSRVSRSLSTIKEE
jgi:hypothetical protein